MLLLCHIHHGMAVLRRQIKARIKEFSRFCALHRTRVSLIAQAHSLVAGVTLGRSICMRMESSVYGLSQTSSLKEVPECTKCRVLRMMQHLFNQTLDQFFCKRTIMMRVHAHLEMLQFHHLRCPPGSDLGLCSVPRRAPPQAHSRPMM